MLRPLLKWAGGKRQLLEELTRLIPERIGTYYEPFFGGGALFFHLWSSGAVKDAVLSDANGDLYNLYTVVRDSPARLVDAIGMLGLPNTSEAYYEARRRFNEISVAEEPVSKAALLLYLNRHCFNGLYRVNSRGHFNVPFGRYRNPSMPSPDHIGQISSALKDATILNHDFEAAVKDCARGDLIYFDPPYMPVSRTSSFTDYNHTGFGIEEQNRLAKVAGDLDRRGVKFILSNSGTELTRNLYCKFNIRMVQAARAINSNPSRRGKVEEIIVTNF